MSTNSVYSSNAASPLGLYRFFRGMVLGFPRGDNLQRESPQEVPTPVLSESLYPSSPLLRSYMIPSLNVPAGLQLASLLPMNQMLKKVASGTCIAENSLYDLRSSQEKLWGQYMDGKVQWSAMLDDARDGEAHRRASLMKSWDIKPEGYVPAAGEDVVFRTGSDPSVSPGRGEFSDEDLTANTMTAWERLRQDAVKRGWEVVDDEDAGFFRVPALNTIVWKPTPPSPALSDTSRFVPHMVTVSTHPEVVDPSCNKPKFAMEYILAMVNKGQVGFSKPVEKWGKGYERYENLIQMAKATHHAMEKSGLSKKEPEAFERLWNLCKMKKSPEELGIFKPKDTEADMIIGLKKEQSQMRQLLSASFALASVQLEQNMQQLLESVEDYKKQCAVPGARPAAPASEKLLKDAKEAHEKLDKIFHQVMIQAASRDHSRFMQRLFVGDQNDQKKYLKNYAAFEHKLENWTRELSAFLEAEWIAGRMDPAHAQLQRLFPKWDESLSGSGGSIP